MVSPRCLRTNSWRGEGTNSWYLRQIDETDYSPFHLFGPPPYQGNTDYLVLPGDPAASPGPFPVLCYLPFPWPIGKDWPSWPAASTTWPIWPDGVVRCKGSIISWRRRRLCRITRSSDRAESLALPNSGELAAYYQILLTELPHGKYNTSFLTESQPTPIPPPFKRAPTIRDISNPLPPAMSQPKDSSAMRLSRRLLFNGP